MDTRGFFAVHEGKFTLLERAGDALCIAISMVIAREIYAGQVAFDASYGAAVAIAIVAFHFVAEAAGLYAPLRGAPLKLELTRVLTSWASVVPALLLAAFVTKTSESFSRFVVLAWFSIAPASIIVVRALVRFGLEEARRRGHNTRRVAIVGATTVGERLSRSIVDAPWLGMQVVGFFDDRAPRRCHAIPTALGTLRGSFDDLVTAARAGSVDLVYVALPLRAESRIAEVVRRLSDTTASVYVVPDFFVFDLLHARVSQVGELPVFSVFETPFHGVNGALKRVEDMVLGAMILALIALPMLLIALGVKLTSRGPVFFRQRRYGLNGEVIEVLKFRTMRVMEDGAVVTQATKNDARITPFGAFLRRTSLDELPQFLHVLTGEMSIVGPRPHAVAHNELYRNKIHGYMLRHKVKPGITGWAQVNGWRGETDTLEKMERRVEHDLEYIRNWGLFWDLKIIVLTIFGTAVRKNAY